MNEPRRLRDSGSGASAEALALLAAAEAPSPLPAATRERVRRALARRRAASERNAVCWSHALGFALALATGVAWILAPRRDPGPEPVLALTPDAPPAAERPREPRAAESLAPEPQPVVAEPAAASEPRSKPASETKLERAAAPARAASRAAPADEQERTVRLARLHERRWAKGAQRSRKRIEALVDEILKPEAQLLERAGREVAHDPEQALALIEAYRRRYPDAPIPAPSVVVEVDALRRLGRFEDALARARALVDGPHKDFYADEMADRFALLDL